LDKLISVIIPIYNVEGCLHRCLDAVQGQTYSNLQIILVDDGSTDHSGKICDEYAAQDARFLVIHKENGGTSSARNAGLEAATGAFIGFLDSDDWPEPDLYETLLDAVLKTEGAVAAQMMSRDFAVDGTLLKGPQRDDGKIMKLTQKEYFKELMLHVGDSSFCTKIIASSQMKDYRFSSHKLNEDFELLLRMLPQIPGIVTIGKVGYNIELRAGSNTRGKYNQALYEAMLENAGYALHMAEELFPDCVTLAKRFELVQALDFMLHIPVEKMTQENQFYQKMKKMIRESGKEIRKNPFLDERQRKNLKRLRFAPRFVRRVHRVLMHFRGKSI